MYDFYSMLLLSCNLHSAFSVSSASSLSEGDSGWKHCFTTPSLTYFERGQVVSVLSALTYGLNFVSPELNFIHRRAKVCSPPRWKLASCRLISDQSSEECVLIKQRVCLPWIQALFILNTGSVWGKCRFYFNCWQSLFIIHSDSDSNERKACVGMNKIWGDFQLLEWCWLTCGMVLADLRNGTFWHTERYHLISWTVSSSKLFLGTERTEAPYSLHKASRMEL